ncbi:hypothetical protein [Duganella sp. S19_KUP01_CR8]|uniref:hypothetical protein n=1 Tax=Duganella sp. S19_KUP01_CR8 TaxID=3025502 RepID=UPI002FCDCABF
MTTLLYRERYWIGAAALAGVALAWYWPSADAPAVPAHTAAAPAWYDRITSSKMVADLRQPSELPLDDQLAPSSLSTDAAGNLVVDAPLRMLFEFFLVRGDGADLNARADQLRDHLDRQVSGPAATQAKTLATRYAAYVRAHDELLASQRIALPSGAAPSPQQVEQLATWQQQRARLRLSSFGPATANLWFGADDAGLAQAVAELREQAATGANSNAADAGGAEPDSNTLRERRLHGATRDAVRDSDTSELLAGATQSYEAVAGEERAWRAHYLRYRADAGRLAAAPGSEARRLQLEALQRQNFPSERERIRARASGIE